MSVDAVGSPVPERRDIPQPAPRREAEPPPPPPRARPAGRGREVDESA